MRRAFDVWPVIGIVAGVVLITWSSYLLLHVHELPSGAAARVSRYKTAPITRQQVYWGALLTGAAMIAASLTYRQRGSSDTSDV